MWNNLSVDIETLGNNTNAIILSIGAIYFNPLNETFGEKFYAIIDLESSMNVGLKPDASTILWWFRQSKESQNIVACEDKLKFNISDALDSFSSFLHLSGDINNLKIWSKSPSFDCVIIKNAYNTINRKIPWNFRNEMDVRTAVQIGNQLLEDDIEVNVVFDGVKHNALDDALFQAKLISYMYQKIM